MGFGFERTAAGTSVDVHQFSLFHIKLLILIYHPFMEAVLAKGFALVFLFQGWFSEFDDVAHGMSPVGC